jgi:hypothetical protein
MIAAGWSCVGCRPTSAPSLGVEKPAAALPAQSRLSQPIAPSTAATASDAASTGPAARDAGSPGRSTPGPGASSPSAPPRRNLADLLDSPPDAAARWLPDAARVKLDEAKVAAAGIRRLESRHLVLYTDLPPSKATDSLPVVFDQAVSQWGKYFAVDEANTRDWRLTGFLIKDRELFRRLELLPADLPPFLHGFSRNDEFWVYEKPGEYLDRHLVLHEGTHAFMSRFLGSCGPPWFMEGMAELLATHRWNDGRLDMTYVPRTSDEVPWLGRVKLVKDAIAAGRGLTLRQVLGYRFDAFLKTEPYAWSWAAALFLDRHPRWGESFRALRKDVLSPDLTARFIAAVGDQWPALERQWEVFTDDLEYGSDVGRMVIDTTRGKPLGPAGAKVQVLAERGWQDSGVWLEQGKKYRLVAQGRYQVAREPKIWWCESNGVTIRYYRGRPLGMLLAMVLPDATAGKGPQAADAGPAMHPMAVGLGTTFVPGQSGTLYFKINESSGALDDNAGGLAVEIRAE